MAKYSEIAPFLKDEVKPKNSKDWERIVHLEQINNQSIANLFFQDKSLYFLANEPLKDLGYVWQNYTDYDQKTTGFFPAMLLQSQIDFINKLDAEGKSKLVFEKLSGTKPIEKNTLYAISKAKSLQTYEKIGIGVGVLFVGYVVYKIIKR